MFQLNRLSRFFIIDDMISVIKGEVPYKLAVRTISPGRKISFLKKSKIFSPVKISCPHVNVNETPVY